jgi:hypothetical protein
LIVDVLSGRQVLPVAHGRSGRTHLVAELLRFLKLGASLHLHLGVVGVRRTSQKSHSHVGVLQRTDLNFSRVTSQDFIREETKTRDAYVIGSVATHESVEADLFEHGDDVLFLFW